MPIFVLTIWRYVQLCDSSHGLPSTQPAHKREEVRSVSISSHTWSSHKFDACHLEHKYQMLA